jgi:hypothetical protein
LTATATGAARIVIGGINIVLAGDQEDICGLQNSHPRGKMNPTDFATSRFHQVARGIVLRHGESTGGL